MAKTISDCRTKVRTYLDESAQVDFLDTEIDTAINAAFHSLVQEVIAVHEGYYETDTPWSISLTDGVREYDLTNGQSCMLKVTRVEGNFDITKSNNYARLTKINKEGILTALNNTDSWGSTQNVGYYVRGKSSAQKIGLYPLPKIVTGSALLKVYGIVLPTDLSDSNPTVDIPYYDNFWQIIPLEAAGFMLSKGQAEEAAGTKYLRLADTLKQKMRIFLKDRLEDGVSMIEDAQGFDSILG